MLGRTGNNNYDEGGGASSKEIAMAFPALWVGRSVMRGLWGAGDGSGPCALVGRPGLVLVDDEAAFE